MRGQLSPLFTLSALQSCLTHHRVLVLGWSQPGPTNRQTDRQRDRQKTDRQTDRPTDRQTDKQTDGRTDGQTDRDIHKPTTETRRGQTDRHTTHKHRTNRGPARNQWRRSGGGGQARDLERVTKNTCAQGECSNVAHYLPDVPLSKFKRHQIC